MLDHLAFARTVVQRIVTEEWQESATSTEGLNGADWSALMAIRLSEQRQPPLRPVPDELSPATNSLPRAVGARSALLVSLVALLLVLSVGAPAYRFDAPIGQPIASWLTR